MLSFRQKVTFECDQDSSYRTQGRTTSLHASIIKVQIVKRLKLPSSLHSFDGVHTKQLTSPINFRVNPLLNHPSSKTDFHSYAGCNDSPVSLKLSSKIIDSYGAFP